MTDTPFAGPMSMVKIDGAKIKLLREQQGLTQLYLATAVEVTTDTISRWENRRYPSIKRDNGLKLAEALNVQLEDILEDIPQDQPEENSSPQLPPSDDLPGEDRPAAQSRPAKMWPLLLLSGTLLLVVIAFIWYFYQSRAASEFTAERILPPHCIAGQPFPVVIKVTRAADSPTALIIKETPPVNGTIKATSPTVTTGGLKNKQIKWLKKIAGNAFFAYMVSVSGKEQQTAEFSGTAAISHESESSISGSTSIVISHYHWADTNSDNIISDNEILAVYEQYGEITDIDFDIDLIEEIWMGSAYRWDAATATYKIID